MKNTLSTILSSFNAPLHIILRRFKVIPIIVLIFFMILTWKLTGFYFDIALELKEWQVAPIFAYLATLTATVSSTLNAIRKGEEKDEHDS